MGIVARQSAHSVVTNVLNKFVIGVLIDVVISRVLGASGKGEYALFVTTMTGLTALFSFGIPFANIVVGAQHKVPHFKLVQLSVYAALIATAVSAIIFFMGRSAGWVTFILPKILSDDYLLLVLLALPFVFLNTFLLGLLIGRGDIVFHNYVLLGSQTGGLFVILLSAATGQLSSSSAIAAYLLTFVLSLAAAVWKLRDDALKAFRATLELAEVKSVTQISFFVYLGAVIQFLNYRLDTYFVEFYLGSASLGIYVTAVRIAETIWILSASMSNAIVVSAAAGSSKARDAAFKLAILALLIGACAAVGFMLLGNLIIVALFSEKFALAAEPLMWLLPGAVVFGIANVLGPYLASIGRTKVNLCNAFAAMLVTIVLDIALIPKFGINGAAVASSVAYILFTALTLMSFAIITKFDLKKTWALVIELQGDISDLEQRLEHIQTALGRIEARQTASAETLSASEFKAFSQMGEDGIIQFLIRHVPIKHKTFVEFGVQDYRESNTRFLLKQNQWKELVIDSNSDSIEFIRRDELSWQHNLTAVCAFITAENINDLLQEHGYTGEIGLLSIDIDGNDYWVWNAISVVSPAIVVIEYNFRFGVEKAVTIPYQPNFTRLSAHPSGIYFGASLKALCRLAEKKGYAFVGCTSAGTNAFFVRRDLKPDTVREMSAEEGFVEGNYRLSRDNSGAPISLSKDEEQRILQSLPLVEIP